MEIIGEIVASVFVLSIVLLLVFWVWAGYHVIKCHRVNNCNNRKCKYWQFCKHNEYERKKRSTSVESSNDGRIYR